MARIWMLALAAMLVLAPQAERAKAAPVATTPVYTLAPDDKVKVVVYGEEALTGEYLVGSDGNVSFPLIGMVKAAGLTLATLQQEITQQLNTGFTNDAKVNVDIVEYRPFYILGEVNKAGQYPYRVGLTMRAAVATAGGFTYRANQRKVAVQRSGETTETKQALTPDLQVRPGDTIRILERFF